MHDIAEYAFKIFIQMDENILSFASMK